MNSGQFSKIVVYLTGHEYSYETARRAMATMPSNYKNSKGYFDVSTEDVWSYCERVYRKQLKAFKITSPTELLYRMESYYMEQDLATTSCGATVIEGIDSPCSVCGKYCKGTCQ